MREGGNNMGSVGASKGVAGGSQYSVDNPLRMSGTEEITVDGKTLSTSNDKIQFMASFGKEASADIYPGQGFVLRTRDMGEGNQLMISNASITKALTGKGDYSYLNLPKEMLVRTSAMTPQAVKAFERIEKAGYKYDIELRNDLGVYRRYKKV